jgi:hypothetical protein
MLVTLAALALVRGPRRILLLVVPVLWGAIAVATLWAMAAWEAGVIGAGVLLALVPMVLPARDSVRKAAARPNPGA